MNRLKILVLLALFFNYFQITYAHADELSQTVQPVQSSETSYEKEPVKSEPSFKQYIGINGGSFIPNNDGSSSKLGLNNFENGYNAGIIFGSKFSKYFALETNIDVYGSDTKQPVQSGIASIATTVTIISTSLSAIATLPLDNFDFFAGIGGGYYNNFMKTTSTTSGVSTTSNSSEGTFGYQLLCGVDINLTKRFAVRAVYKYFVDNPEFTFTDDTKRSINFGGSIISGGIMFRY